MTTPRRALLEEAAKTIDGDRNATYGGPEASFKAIALLWNTYLQARGPHAVQPQDVAAMLALLKIARIAGSGGTHKDSWLDLAGYAACGWETMAAKEPAEMTTVKIDTEALKKIQEELEKMPSIKQPWPAIE